MERALEPLDITDPNSIEDWFERFEFYVLTNTNITDSKIQIAHLMTLMGKDAYKLLKELSYPKTPADLTPPEIKKSFLVTFRTEKL